MTRELLLMRLGGELFGAWRAGFREIVPVRAGARLSAGGGLVAAVLDGRMRILCNVAACLGLEEAARAREGNAILAGSEGEIAGYFCGGDVKALEVGEDRVAALPASAQSPVIRFVTIVDGLVVPIVELECLPAGGGAGVDRGSGRMRPEPNEPREFIVVFLGGVPVAISGERVEATSLAPEAERTLPLAPPGVGGIAATGGRVVVLPRLPLAAAASSERALVVADIAGESYGIRADAAGEAVPLASRRVEPMPPLLARSWLHSCVVADDAVIPILDLRLLAAGDGGDEPGAPAPYELGSDFGGRFLRQEVEVVEIESGSGLYAIPGSEAGETLDRPATSPLPSWEGRRGVVLHEGRLLPVLGTGTAQAVVVRNGSFACIVGGAHIGGRRMIPLDLQRALPIPSPGGTVYGCYVDRGGVTLVLNVAATALRGEGAELCGPAPAPPASSEELASRGLAWRQPEERGDEPEAEALPAEPEVVAADVAEAPPAAPLSEAPAGTPAEGVEAGGAEPSGAGAATEASIPAAASEGQEPVETGAVVVEEVPFTGVSLPEEPELVPSFQAADWSSGRTEAAGPEARAAEVAEPAPRRRRWWLFLAAATILAVGGILLWRLPASRAPASPTPASPAPASGAAGEEAGDAPAAPLAGPEAPAGRTTVVYFAANSAVIDPSAERLLDDAASAIAALGRKPVEVTITGHTALAETAELREALSLGRAEAVRDYLAARLPAGSLTARCGGRGAEEPAAPNDTKENMSLNRRAVVEIVRR